MGSLVFTGAALAAITALQDVLLQPQARSVSWTPAAGPQGILIPDCVIEERHKDELAITRSPVEQGSPVADHAYKKPCELVLRWAWSNSPSLSALLNTIEQGNNPFSQSVRSTYEQLQNLQANLLLLTISTGKRKYKNMLLRSLQVVTSRESENALMVEAGFEEVLFVTTQLEVTNESIQYNPSDYGSQANPQNTAATVSTGAQQLGPANSAAASTISGLAP
jgi:hypothetical protein